MQLGLFVVFQNSYTITDDKIMCLNVVYCVTVQHVFSSFLRIYR